MKPCRAFGTLTKTLCPVYEKYEDTNLKLPLANVRKAFNDLDLFPSQSQIMEMVHCAVEYGSPCPADHITFGEFSVLVQELKHHYQTCSGAVLPRSIQMDRREVTSRQRQRKESLTMFEVFLGGSCNPTTWRHDIAIPFLKKHEITFYNPQVNEWRPELMELEEKAKQAAKLLLFVIDDKTRAVVSMLEVAYFVGCQRQLLVVMNEYSDDTNITLNGDSVCMRELEDLKRARRVLVDIIERNSIPIFHSLEPALQCVHLILHQGYTVQTLAAQHGARPVKHGHSQVGEAVLKLRETFNSITSNRNGVMSFDDVRLGYKCFTGHTMEAQWLQRLRPHQTSFSFEEFCCIMAEYQAQTPPWYSTLFKKLSSPFSWIAQRMHREPSRLVLVEEEDVRDVYLGGSCGESDWRENIAMPALRRHGMSYVNPFVSEWSARLIPMQVGAREKCRVMLYVITACTRAVASMVEAAYYIGLDCKVVLCVQKLPEDLCIADDPVPQCAIKDYNRGRMYLTDFASRKGVPVFDKIVDAINCVISMVKIAKYEPLANQLRSQGISTSILAIEVGARGFVGHTLHNACRQLGLSSRQCIKAAKGMAEAAEKGSMWIWMNRNSRDQSLAVCQ